MSTKPNQEFQLLLFNKMLRIRMIEEEIASRYPEGNMRCPTHLSIGQEAIAAIVGSYLNNSDLAVSTHRAHAHYLAKGGNLKAMIAELYGKKNGCSGGKGGSMHLVDTTVGFMGSTAIVSNSIPIGAGLALASQLNGDKNIVCIFLGDGAVEEGVFYETVNFAAVRDLPLVFICENNLYSVYSSLKPRQPLNREIHEMVDAIGVTSTQCSGIEVLNLNEKVSQIIAEVRETRRPQFIEISTYRWREHCGPNYDDDLNYRDKSEIKYWKENDALTLFKEKLISQNLLRLNDIEEMSKNIKTEIFSAFEYAEKSEFPESQQLYMHVTDDSDSGIIPWLDN